MTAASTAGFVLFRLGEQTFASGLDDVREIVRLDGLEPLPGATAPLAGLIVVRGAPLPVFDVRVATDASAGGDVLVVETRDGRIGIAVDQVVAVVSGDELPPAEDEPVRALPPYVVGVRRRGAGPVLLVDLPVLLDATNGGWAAALDGVTAVQT